MLKGHYLRRGTLSCVQCQHLKVHRHTVTPMGFFSPPDARFDHVDIDIVGPLPPATGNMHSQTCVDCFTCWPEVILLSDTSTETVAQAFLLGWIAQFGIPTTLTSDQGGQFESNVWNHLMQLLGIHCIHTTAYISSLFKWSSRTSTSPIQGFTDGPCATDKLGQIPAPSTTLHSHSTKGRHPAYQCRTCVWDNSVPLWSIFC